MIIFETLAIFFNFRKQDVFEKTLNNDLKNTKEKLNIVGYCLTELNIA